MSLRAVDGPLAGVWIHVNPPASFPHKFGEVLYWPRVRNGELVLTVNGPPHPYALVAWMIEDKSAAPPSPN